jgi:TonB-dependent SusC/RagA subfamily outer membrane receptor
MNNFSFYRGGKAFCFLFLMGIILSFSPIQASNSSRQRHAQTQQIKIQGTVTDGINTLPGVNVSIKNRSNAYTVSDYNGQYELIASTQDTLVFSYVGFKTEIVPVNGRSLINIVLQADATTLKEVKINAGYYNVKESERTGSIARITAADIEKQPVTNVLATMQGRMAGVDVVQDSGSSGGSFSIKIRGQNSLRSDGNQPLYIIDGVPYSSETIGSTATSGTAPSLTSPLNSINPQDIESIEVLKDADATAIYGSRGANGVVLITTKKGKAGGPRFTINSSTSFGSVTKSS